MNVPVKRFDTSFFWINLCLIPTVAFAFFIIGSPVYGENVGTKAGPKNSTEIPSTPAESWKQLQEIISADFDSWSGGQDEISLQQLGRLEKNPNITGQQAAALGLTTQLLSNKIHRDNGVEPRISLYDLLSEMKSRNTSLLFTRAMKELTGDVKNGKLLLFGANRQPLGSTSGIYQSAMSDCYTLAPIESIMLRRGPEFIKGLIKSEGNNEFTISLPGAHPLTFALTQAEIAEGNVDIGEQGCWLQVLDKAFAKLIEENSVPAQNEIKRNQQKHYALTSMGELQAGTTQLQVLQWLTNEMYDAVEFDHNKDNTKLVMTLLAEAIKDKYPIGLFTPGHSMAVVDWDSSTQTLTVMNPWGVSGKYQPRADGDTFEMVEGRFQLSFQQLKNNFAGIEFPKKLILQKAKSLPILFFQQNDR